MRALAHCFSVLALPVGPALRALVALVTLAAAGCTAPPQQARIAYLKVIAEPRQTTVYQNDRFIGSAHLLQKQPKAMVPGVKYLTFKAPGYFPHDLRLTLPAGETSVKIKLRPIPP